MSNKSIATIATMGIDIGKNSFHVVGLDQPIVLRQKWSLAGRPVYPGYLPTLLQHTSRQLRADIVAKRFWCWNEEHFSRT